MNKEERTFADHVRVGDQVEELAKDLHALVLTLSLHLNSSTECFGDVLFKEQRIKSVHDL